MVEVTHDVAALDVGGSTAPEAFHRFHERTKVAPVGFQGVPCQALLGRDLTEKEIDGAVEIAFHRVSRRSDQAAVGATPCPGSSTGSRTRERIASRTRSSASPSGTLLPPRSVT